MLKVAVEGGQYYVVTLWRKAHTEANILGGPIALTPSRFLTLYHPMHVLLRSLCCREANFFDPVVIYSCF